MTFPPKQTKYIWSPCVFRVSVKDRGSEQSGKIISTWTAFRLFSWLLFILFFSPFLPVLLTSQPKTHRHLWFSNAWIQNRFWRKHIIQNTPPPPLRLIDHKTKKTKTINNITIIIWVFNMKHQLWCIELNSECLTAVTCNIHPSKKIKNTDPDNVLSKSQWSQLVQQLIASSLENDSCNLAFICAYVISPVICSWLLT